MLFARTNIHFRVEDAERSAAFYEALLGAPPARRGEGTAVFESDSPPLVLTVEKRTGRRGPVAHAQYSLVVTAPQDIGHAAVALRRAGIRLRLEDQGIETHDPDGNEWLVRFQPSASGRLVIASDEGPRR
jgi:catechol 2,3-dioxygenase-like lactoylglutathione lyase family enzyme